jgi:RNA polymerase sigma-70 factor (ECF subfamily)
VAKGCVTSLKNADLETIRRARDGSAPDFERLVSHYSQFAFRIALGILDNRNDAEELVQEAFVTVYHRLTGLKGIGSFPAWLAKIVTNLCLQRLKKRPPLVSLQVLGDRPETNDHTTDPEAAYLKRENSMIVWRAIRELPDSCRVTLILREFQGCSYAEIAHILGIPPGTVKSRLHQARTLLARKLDPDREV